jgi:hypothetical protein
LIGARTEVELQRSVTSDLAQVLYDPFEDLSSHNLKGNISESLHQTGPEGLRLNFENLAMRITNRVQRMTTPTSANTNPDPYVVYNATGQVLVQVTKVHIRWPWITAHICFVLFSAGLLGATTFAHRKTSLRGKELWKSSGIAVLHAHEPELQKEMGVVEKMLAVQERGVGKTVRLRQVEGEG